MTVELFGKENCKLCAQVKDKLARMKVPEPHSLTLP